MGQCVTKGQLGNGVRVHPKFKEYLLFKATSGRLGYGDYRGRRRGGFVISNALFLWIYVSSLCVFVIVCKKVRVVPSFAVGFLR